MKSTFSEYYKPTATELTSLWQESLFVIDANVVLNLYRYPEGARNELLKSLEGIKNRLWMPFQAGLEYQRNRLGLIGEQKKAFDTINSKLNSAVADIKKLFSARHPLIEPGNLIVEIERLVATFIENLEPLSEKQPAVYHDDAIREAIDALLAEKIGPAPTVEELKAICVEGVDRYSRKIPPGFMDEKKGDLINFQGSEYESKYGDLILWRQMIERAKQKDVLSVIFITNDSKDDWWHKISGETVGPLPALREEMLRLTGGKKFHMYTTEGFLRSSKEYLHFQISTASIDQVAEINEAVKEDQNESRYDRAPVNEGQTTLIVTPSAHLIEADRKTLAGRIFRVVSHILPPDFFTMVDQDFEFVITTRIESFNEELISTLMSLSGVMDVRTTPSSWRRSILGRHRLGAEESSRLRLFEIFIKFDDLKDPDKLHLINWIKMIFQKEFASFEPRDARPFSTHITASGMRISLNIPMLYRDARHLLRAIEKIDGVKDSKMVEA